MLFRRIMRRNKHQQVTLMVRLAAVLMAAVMLMIVEFAYILVAKPGQTKAYAEDNPSENVIVIPAADDSESVSEDEADRKKDEKPVEPEVKIKITEPSGWHRKSAEVRISAEDTVGTGDFEIKEVRAKIGNTGSWTDVMDSMSMELKHRMMNMIRTGM